MKRNWAELIGDDFPLFRAALEEAGVDKAKAQLIIEEVVAYKRANLEWAEYTVNALQEARAEVASLTARLNQPKKYLETPYGSIHLVEEA